MANSVHQTLGELRVDHRNMSVLLSILESEAQNIQAARKVDFELLSDIMMYLTVYADTVHHPKEDVVYAQLLKEDPTWADSKQRVLDEHEEIAGLGLALRRDVDAVTFGAAVTRSQIVADLSAYCDRLRKHMLWEESDLFLQADKLPADWTVPLHDAAMRAVDPVFGGDQSNRFAALLKHLQTRSAELAAT